MACGNMHKISSTHNNHLESNIYKVKSFFGIKDNESIMPKSIILQILFIDQTDFQSNLEYVCFGCYVTLT